MREEQAPTGRTTGLSAVRLPRDAIVGACILVFCAAAFAVTLTFRKAPAALAQNVQPATFPRLVIGTMAVLAVVVIVQAFAQEQRKLPRIPLMVPVSAAVMVGFVLTFQWLGIIPAMVALCVGLPVLWGERRWRLILPFAVLLPTAVYVLFAEALGVYFEPGPLLSW